MSEKKKGIVVLHADLDFTRANLMQTVLFQVLNEMGLRMDYQRVETKEDALKCIWEKSPSLLVLGSPFTDETDVGDDCEVIVEEMKSKNPKSNLLFQTREPATLYELGYVTKTAFVLNPVVDKKMIRSCLKYFGLTD